MKTLIVDNGILGETIKIIIASKTSVILSSHEDALETFLLEDPEYVLIFESWSNKSVELSTTTAIDIRNSAAPEIIVKTIGFDEAKDLMLPIESDDILRAYNLA